MVKRIFVLALLALAACNSATSEPLPSSASDPKLPELMKRLSDEEKGLLTAYLMRREMAKAFGAALPDSAATVGDALKAQRDWANKLSESQRRAEELKAEIAQKRKIVSDQIARAVTVAFIDARYVPSSFEAGRYDDYEELIFAVQNIGGKPIKALKGQAVWLDTFGEEYVRVPMQVEEAVAPAEKKTVELSKEINKFMDDDKRIMNLDSSKVFKFEPEQIVFADGSTLKAPAAAD